MRHFQRAVITLIGVALMGMVPLSGASANAETSRGYEAGATAPAAQVEPRVEARRVRRAISIRFKCTSCARSYFFVGKCPRCNGGTPVLLQRAGRINGAYTTVRRVRTKATGYYTFKDKQVTGRFWWRVKATGNTRYFPAYSDKICVDRINENWC